MEQIIHHSPKFRLGKVFQKYLVLEAFQNISKHHTLYKLYYISKESRQLLIRFYKLILNNFSEDPILTLNSDDWQNLINTDEKFSRLCLNLTQVDLSPSLNILKEHNIYLEKIAFDVRSGNNNDIAVDSLAQYCKQTKASKLQLIYGNQQIHKMDFEQLPNVRELYIQLLSSALLSPYFNNPKSLLSSNLTLIHLDFKVFHYLSPHNINFIKVLLNMPQLQKLILQKLQAKEAFAMIDQHEDDLPQVLFKKIQINKIVVNSGDEIQQILDYREKYKFQIIKAIFNEMHLAIDQQLIFFKLITSLTQIKLHQIFIDNFDTGLLDAIYALKCEIKSFQISYFYFYDCDPVVLLLNLITQKTLEKLKVSFITTDKSPYEHLRSFFEDKARKMKHEKLKEIEFGNCTGHLLKGLSSLEQPFKIEKLTISDNLITDDLAQAFDTSALKHLKFKQSMGMFEEEDNLKQQARQFITSFKNLESIEFHLWDVLFQNYNYNDKPLLQNLKVVKIRGDFKQSLLVESIKAIVYIFQNHKKLQCLEIILDKDHKECWQLLSISEKINEKERIFAKGLSKQSFQIKRQKIQEDSNE